MPVMRIQCFLNYVQRQRKYINVTGTQSMVRNHMLANADSFQLSTFEC